MRPPLSRLVACAALGLVAGPAARGQTLYWNGTGSSWTDANAWNSGSATGPAVTWADGRAATFSRAGAVIDLGSAVNPTGTSVTANTNLTFSNASGSLSGPVTLGANVVLSLGPTGRSGSRDLTLTGVLGPASAGNGSGLTVQGGQSAGNAERILLGAPSGSTTGATIAVPVTILESGAGAAGFVSTLANGATATTATVSGAIANSSSGPTLLGAAAGTTLTVSGGVSGSAGVLFATTAAGGGTGTVVLTGASTYTGTTVFGGGGSAGGPVSTVRLGVDNALPTGTALIMGAGANLGNNLDLFGHNQTVGSLASGGGVGFVTNSAAGTGTNTLTVAGSASTSFALGIQDGATAHTALALGPTDTGTLTLAGPTTYTGGTTLAGGTLQLGAANALPTAGNVALSGGTLSTGTAAGVYGQATTGTLTANGGHLLFGKAGGSGQDLTFGGLSGSTTPLLIDGWTGAAGGHGTGGHIYFTSINGSTSASAANAADKAFLADVQFTGGSYGPGATFLAYAGELELVPAITPTPEPAGVLAVAAVGLGAAGVARRRRGVRR